MKFWAQPGDILLYSKPPNLSTKLIEVGERLEDGKQPMEFYHVAVALDQYTKIEAQGKTVATAPIDYECGHVAIFRPPIPKQTRDVGLRALLRLEGEPYDWWLIIDDGLRDLTHNWVHLPRRFIHSEDRRKKICSSLAALYLRHTGWDESLGVNTSPEDIWLSVRDYRVWPMSMGG